MRRVKIYSVLLALASLFLFAVQPAWAFTEVSAQNAYNAVSAGNGVIIDVRSVEEHNGCNANWQGAACPTAEAGNRGAPAWQDPGTGVWMQAAVVPWWIDAIGNFTSPQNSTEFRNSFQALLDSGYITKSSPVYVICRSGGRSRAAAGWIEANMGFTNVYNIDGDGTGSNDGGMLEWTATGLPVPWDTSINRGWKPPQIFSITPVDGTTETASNTVTFSYGILEPTWGYLSYGNIVRISLYMDGGEVASSTTDPTSGALWTTGSFTVDVPNGDHIWDVRAEAEVLTPGAPTIFGFNRLADDLGPGGRALTVNTVTLEPNISVSPTSLDFGSVTVGYTSSAQTVTVSNTGTANLNVGSVSTTGDFTIQTDNCSGATVSAGGNCTVDVVFEPTAEGALSGTLSIPSDDPDTSNVNVALSGTGTVVPEPNISVSPAAKDFGSVTVGETSAPQTFTVSNTGTADLNIYAVTKTGDFTITADSCSSATVTAGSNCTVTVLFAPASEGFLTGTISIPSDDPDTPTMDVALSGTGVAATVPLPNISVTPSSLAFGNVVVGETSAPQTVTVANTGNADLTVTNVVIIGDFAITSTTCVVPTLAPGASCTADVVFSPTGLGDLNGILSIESDDPDSAVVDVALSGTGIPTPEPDISVSPTTVDFGSVIIGNTSAQTVTVTNAGSATLNVGTLAVTGDYSTANDNCSGSAVAVGDNCTVDVVFAPSTATVLTGTLSIPSDDPDTAVVDVALSGTGVAPQPDITVSTTSVDFGSVTVGDTADSQVVTVTNDGTADLNITSVSSLSDPFSTTDGCTGTLAPTESCAVTVNFAPSAVGTFSDSLVITSDDPDEASVTVSVSGESVELGANQPPTKPELLYPENGATGVSRNDLPLVWKKATDPDGDVITYEVKYCEDAGLTENCETVTVDDTTASAKGNDSSMFAGLGAGAGLLLFGFVFAGSARRRKMALLIGMMILTAMFLVSCGDDVTPENTTGTVISGLDANTTYYWQVTASDGQSSTLSDVWSFKTESGKKRRGM